MRQTLFYIPHELFGLPVLGVGWALLAWCLFGIVVVVLAYRRHGWGGETVGYFPILGLMAAAIVFILPNLEVGLPDEVPLGLPIRGYGTMMLLAVVAGVGLSLRRAAQVGIDADTMYSLAFWMVIVGIPSARVFFVIQNWADFQAPTIGETARNIVMYTEGGLVVYGSVIGVVIAVFVFSRKKRIAPLKLADVIAPGMVLGLALGRIGCLLNGCCYGGLCDAPWAITFPQYASRELQTYSPPYSHQLSYGLLHGMRIQQDGDVVKVASVTPGGMAEAVGLKPDDTIERINRRPVTTLNEARSAIMMTVGALELSAGGSQIVAGNVNKLPARSLPVHPTQLYSTINATLLCFLLYAVTPYCTRQGQVFAIMIVLYAVTRFCLEIIRTDEPGQFGTVLTISQWVSCFMFVGGVALLVYLRRDGERINLSPAD